MLLRPVYVVFLLAGASGSLTHMLVSRLSVEMTQKSHIDLQNLGLVVISVKVGKASLDPRG